MKVKKSITLSRHVQAKVRKWPARLADPNNFSAKLEEMLTDFLVLFERTQKRLQNIFAPNEMHLLYDTFNGHIFDLHLDLKQTFLYEVQDAELRQKLESLAEFEIYVLSKIIEDFWHKQAKQG